jgi:hypothetical protein
MSIARNLVEPKVWHAGYSPHPTLIANSISLGDLLDLPAFLAAPVAGLRDEMASG